MAKSVAAAILRDTSGYNKSGGRAKATLGKTPRKSGNKGSFRGRQGAGTRNGKAGTINTGGNYGALGY